MVVYLLKIRLGGDQYGMIWKLLMMMKWMNQLKNNKLRMLIIKLIKNKIKLKLIN